MQVKVWLLKELLHNSIVPEWHTIEERSYKWAEIFLKILRGHWTLHRISSKVRIWRQLWNCLLACGILPHGGVATSHKAMVSSHWCRRLQWRQAQETRDSDNSDHTKRQFELVTRLGQSLSTSTPRAARGLLCVQCGYRDNVVSVNLQTNH
jgi:hypothetical protein